jgi:nucleotide-binding universal stress UspA family protein
MFRNLLVHIPTERSVRAAVDGSIATAKLFGARLDAVAIGYEPSSIPFVVDGGAAVVSIYEVEHHHAFERANAALGVFEKNAEKAGIAYHCHAICGALSDTSAIIGAIAQLHDLTIVSQPDLTRITYDNEIPQELLFRAGGPVLYMPRTFEGSFAASRIGICWDGSQIAARTVRDAWPFLERASITKIIAVNEPAESPAIPSSAQLAARLASDGISTKIVALSADRAAIQASILSVVADEDLDLLVMGAYGHSRLRERLIGGVTRDMLACMTVPVLMSH